MGFCPPIAILILGNFIFLTLIHNKSDLSKYYFLILLPIIIHLFFNLGLFKKFKIFLGDSGSSLIGFTIAFLTIYNYKFENIHPVLMIWSMSYIIYEFLFVNIFRISKRNKLFKPGLDHLHFELKRNLNLNNYLVLLILMSLNLIFICIGYFLYLNSILA